MVGIEGTGSYGAGVARLLTSRGHTVVEVSRYRKGKSDPTDAEMAARSVLAGVAEATPKSGEGEVEMIRMLKSAKDSAVKARTQAFNQMKALIVTAPAELRETLVGLTAGALINLCKSFRPGRLDDPTAAAKYTLRSLARRYRQLSKEIHDLEGELERLTRTISPALVDSYGIGPDTAATLLVAAGSNPERLHSEASFASLCGVNPIPASSGKTNRHRLNRGGHRQANADRIVVVRLRYDPRTQSYMRRRTMEGMSKAEIIRPQTLRSSRSLLCPTDLGPNSSSHDLTSIGASGWSLSCASLAPLPSSRPTRCSGTSSHATTSDSVSPQPSRAQPIVNSLLASPSMRHSASSTCAPWPTTTPSGSTAPPYRYCQMSTGPATLAPRWRSRNGSTAASWWCTRAGPWQLSRRLTGLSSSGPAAAVAPTDIRPQTMRSAVPMAPTHAL